MLGASVVIADKLASIVVFKQSSAKIHPVKK